MGCHEDYWSSLAERPDSQPQRRGNPELSLKPVGSSQQGIDELLGIERRQIVSAFAEANELDRHP